MGGQKSDSASKSGSEARTPEQKKLLSQAIDIYGPQLGQNENVFQGDRVAPFSTLQNRAVSGAENITDDFATTPQRAGTPLQGQVESTTSDFLAGERGAKNLSTQDVSDFFEQTIATPTKAALRDEILPGIDESFAGPGFFAADRSQGKQRAIQNTSDTLTQNLAELQFRNLQQNQTLDENKAGRAQAAINQGLAVGQVPAQEIKNNLDIASKQLGNLGIAFGIGQAEQTQQQAEFEGEILRFAEENQITDPENLQIVMALLSQGFSSSFSKSKSSSVGIQLA